MEGLPENAGLIEANVLIRRHNNPLIRELMEDWWEQLRVHGRRDQISFPYVAWKHGFWPNIMGDENVWGNSQVFLHDESRHHGPKHPTLMEKLRVLWNVYIRWRL